MATLVFAGRLAQDLARIEAHLRTHEVEDVEARLAEIVQALDLLARHPLIGRKVSQGRRELVIGQGSRGYVARYGYDPVAEVVAVAALRSQRESGFRG